MLYSKAITYLGLPLTTFSSSQFWPLYRRFGSRRGDGIFSDSNTLASVQQLLRHAAAEVPFYRERFQTCGLHPNDLTGLDQLLDIPPITKADIAANFPDRITAENKCFSPWRYASTSGTLERLTVIHDFRKRDYIRASQLFALRCAANYEPGLRYLEIPPNICTNVCGVSDTVEPRLMSYVFSSIKEGNLFDKETISNIKGMIERQVIYRQLQLPSFNQDGMAQKAEVMDDYLQKIDAFKPHLVKALPVYLYLLAQRILDGGIKPRISHCIMPMGASMTPHMKQVIEQAFGVPVKEDYGCAELGSIGAQCDSTNAVDIFSQLFYVEVIHKGKPAAIGQPGRVLITDLFNYAMPLIRYDIGDTGMWVEGAPGTRPKLRLLGRLQDSLLNCEGALVSADEITDAVLSAPGVLGFQLEADQTDIDIQVTPKPGQCIELDAISSKLTQLLGEQYQIYAQESSTIMPESSGKYRLVKNLSKSALNAV